MLNTIKKNLTFKYVFAKGSVKRTPALTLRFVGSHQGCPQGLTLRHDGTNAAKFGIVVSKKQLRRAVDRNLLKRRLRYAIAQCEKQQPAPPGLYVFVVHRLAISVPYSDLLNMVKKVLYFAKEYQPSLHT